MSVGVPYIFSDDDYYHDDDNDIAEDTMMSMTRIPMQYDDDEHLEDALLSVTAEQGIAAMGMMD